MKSLPDPDFTAPFPDLRWPADFRPQRLLLILGDQLDPRYLEHADFDAETDGVLMMEVAEEATHVPSHKARTALFLAAMRHAALKLRARGVQLHYSRLDDPENAGSFAGELRRLVARSSIRQITLVRPGEWRVLQAIEAVAAELGVHCHLVEDPHFLTTTEAFSSWSAGRSQLVLEHFYRWQRRRLDILLDPEGRPEGGSWNFDKENRKPLGRGAPPIPPPIRFTPDALTREVIELVERFFPDAPGSLASFAWPATRAQAKAALDDFMLHRLEHFGAYQDAMKQGEPWLFHSLLSPALNLKLLDPREVVEAAVERYRTGAAPIQAVEGFVRQIIGWRELIRGIYWQEGPSYVERNELEADSELPEAYWTGETDMVCMQESVGQVLEHGYGHHIQRLMITGNYALLAGVEPRQVSDWYLGLYVDAVDWVTLPNTLGMVLYADGGVVATKPYAASGRYVSRMSDYCRSCRFDPAVRTGESACPLTTLYWDFLDRHRDRLANNRRMSFAWRNLDRLDEDELAAVRAQAKTLRRAPEAGA